MLFLEYKVKIIFRLIVNVLYGYLQLIRLCRQILEDKRGKSTPRNISLCWILSPLQCTNVVSKGNFLTQAALVFANTIVTTVTLLKLRSEWSPEGNGLCDRCRSCFRGAEIAVYWNMSPPKGFYYCSWLHEAADSVGNFRVVFFVLMAFGIEMLYEVEFGWWVLPFCLTQTYLSDGLIIYGLAFL